MKVINLLPKREQELIKEENILAVLQSLMIYSFITYFLVLATLIGTRLWLDRNFGSLNDQIARRQAIIAKQDNTILRSSINTNNAIVADYNNLAQKNPTWSRILEDFAKLVPDGVEVKTFNGSTSTGKIQIGGLATTREAVLQLRINILNSPDFEKIDLPLDNLQQPTDVNFHYTFNIKQNVLRADKGANLVGGGRASAAQDPSAAPAGN